MARPSSGHSTQLIQFGEDRVRSLHVPAVLLGIGVGFSLVLMRQTR